LHLLLLRLPILLLLLLLTHLLLTHLAHLLPVHLLLLRLLILLLLLLLVLNRRWRGIRCWWLVPGDWRQGPDATGQLNACGLLLLWWRLLSVYSSIVSVPVLWLLSLQVRIVRLTGVAAARNWCRSEAPSATTGPSQAETLLLWLLWLRGLHSIAVLRGPELGLWRTILLLLGSSAVLLLNDGLLLKL
jgi:hypothetical protein